MSPTEAQRLHALELGNIARRGAAEIKRELTAGTLSIADALVDPRVGCLLVEGALLACPGVGRSTLNRLLFELRLSPLKRVDTLTERQRAAIVGALAQSQGICATLTG